MKVRLRERWQVLTALALVFIGLCLLLLATGFTPLYLIRRKREPVLSPLGLLQRVVHSQ
ncbi:hypothetical protein BOX15_Mlig011283g6 [Macrostomum lignano]|uniref:Uncharacterized protein n=1 Tax=Macrostomum lignano TaxID=282301 RepID=A0A267FIP2_9PLAT|nr:hypothetical protein BOX15_Mlig011283g4 [Macrostomum lignano]PAA72852.1 hypothetical protein BOX15_Mlig011283g2 [Macrostomum lignano]PAA72857.1 hypothetical protein BOX15_Mlig011283g1 [Macrostomum lignano]PAA93840.1 hypothetical protein BOX15_Mlig011283g6 [Macrostomum lignano]